MQNADEEGKRRRKLIDIPPGITTLAVRNVPWGYMQAELLSVWPPENSYDYLHLPHDFRHTRITTYAFLNFISHRKAQEFTERWHGRFLPEYEAPKSLSVAVAKTQGLRANLARLSSRELDDLAAHDVMPVTLYKNVLIDCRILYVTLGIKAEEEANQRVFVRAEAIDPPRVRMEAAGRGQCRAAQPVLSLGPGRDPPEPPHPEEVPWPRLSYDLVVGL